MRHWNSRKALLHLTAILFMTLSLALMGCGDDGQGGGGDLTPQDLAGKTFILPASFFVPALPGTASVTFAATNFIVDDTIPFTVTFSGAPPNTVVTGIATVSSIELEITNITVAGVSVDSVNIGDETVEVGDTFNIDTQVETLANGTFVITWTNDDGDVVVFSFAEDEDTATGTGGTGGGN